MLLSRRAFRIGTTHQGYRRGIIRPVSTLPHNPDIYIHDGSKPGEYILSYLKTSPPNAALAIGTARSIPPTPETFKQNDELLKLIHWVIKEHAVEDPAVQQQAAVFASQAGVDLGSGGSMFQRGNRRQAVGRDGGASSQGGMGGGGRGGYIHVSDQRNPPDYGRIAWPEDIFGSLELDGKGQFVEPKGRYQESGTYRTLTTEGMLGLSPFLKDKVKEKLKELDAQSRV